MSRLATPIRKNDTVIVITGKDRGKRGRVLKVLAEREAGLHASNVQVLCPECGKPTRLGRRILGDGRKVRICRKCEGVVDK